MLINVEELKDTVELMTSDNYKERFIAEYYQTKIRYDKLKAFCNRIEAAELCRTTVASFSKLQEPKHDCPLFLLRDQQGMMGQYLSILEKRAVIEGIDLGKPDYYFEELAKD